MWRGRTKGKLCDFSTVDGSIPGALKKDKMTTGLNCKVTARRILGMS
jgi:hypothetical protein